MILVVLFLILCIVMFITVAVAGILALAYAAIKAGFIALAALLVAMMVRTLYRIALCSRQGWEWTFDPCGLIDPEGDYILPFHDLYFHLWEQLCMEYPDLLAESEY